MLSNTEFARRIIAALGKHLSIKEVDKNNFARAICDGAQMWKTLGDDRRTIPKNLAALKKTLPKIQKAMHEFVSLLEISPDAEQIDRETRQKINVCGIKVSAHDFLSYIDEYAEHLTKHVVLETSQRTDTEVSFTIARYIALTYVVHLGKAPSSGKGDTLGNGEPKLTPFDRVCKVVADYLSIEIPPSTCNRATQEMKKTTHD